MNVHLGIGVFGIASGAVLFAFSRSLSWHLGLRDGGRNSRGGYTEQGTS